MELKWPKSEEGGTFDAFKGNNGDEGGLDAD